MILIRGLFFLNSLSGGGAEKVCLTLARRLFELDIESDFVTVFDRKADYDIPEYIHVFSLCLKEPFLTRLSMIKLVPKVNDFISNKQYILISAHLQPAYQLASFTKAGKKCLYVMHVSQSLDDKKHSRFYKMKLRYFFKNKKIITVSKGLQDELNNVYGICQENITTIYNPCDMFLQRSEKKQRTLHERPYILIMGRLEEQKNPLLALELYYRGSFYNNYDLIYLGKGSLENTLKRKISAYNMQDFVYLMGFQKNTESWLVNASLLLSCSRQEGLPLNLIEALMCGTPVVAADCPHGPNEILVGKLARYLIDPENDLEGSIATVSCALNYYPIITEEYFTKFDSELIVKIYMDVWKKYFGSE